jgi:hypothetical protein
MTLPARITLTMSRAANRGGGKAHSFHRVGSIVLLGVCTAWSWASRYFRSASIRAWKEALPAHSSGTTASIVREHELVHKGSLTQGRKDQKLLVRSANMMYRRPLPMARSQGAPGVLTRRSSAPPSVFHTFVTLRCTSSSSPRRSFETAVASTMIGTTANSSSMNRFAHEQARALDVCSPQRSSKSMRITSPNGCVEPRRTRREVKAQSFLASARTHCYTG